MSVSKDLSESSDDILTVSTSETSADTEKSVKIEVTPSSTQRPDKLALPSIIQPATKFRSPFRSKTVQEKKSGPSLLSEEAEDDEYIEITVTRTITEEMTEASSDEDSLHSDQPMIRNNSIGMAALLAGRLNSADIGQMVSPSRELPKTEPENETATPVQAAVRSEQRKKRKYRRQVAKSLPLDILCKEDTDTSSPKTSTVGLVSNHNSDTTDPESQATDEQTLNHFLKELSSPVGNEPISRGRLNQSIKASPSHVKFQLDVDQIDLHLETKQSHSSRPNILNLPAVRHLSRKYHKSSHKSSSRKPSPAVEVAEDGGAVLTHASSLNPSKISTANP